MKGKNSEQMKKSGNKTHQVMEHEMTLSDALECLYQSLKDTTFEDTLTSNPEALATAMDILHINEIQSLLITSILNESGDGYAGVNSILRTLGISNIKFLGFKKDLDELIELGMVREGTMRSGAGYSATPQIIRAVQYNQPISFENITGLATDQIFKHLYNIFRDYNRRRMGTQSAFTEIAHLVQFNLSDPLIKECVETYHFPDYPIDETILAFYLMHSKDAFRNTEWNIYDVLEDFEDEVFINSSELASMLRNQKTQLQKYGFVEFVCDDGQADTTQIKLCDKVTKMIEDLTGVTEVENEPGKIPDDELLRPDAIAKKKMFYNEGDEAQISTLESILRKSNYKRIRKRMDDAQMRGGLCCLLYGAPGCGKTETVLQLAKKTGRSIYMVDVTKLKSKWVGESESAVKQLFDKYERLATKSHVAPILVFNEADAIFGVRNDNALSSVDKMNNTIQNIILGEMEKMDGILMATTNLTTNLDPAFERRFLFKMHFNKPDQEVRAKLWKSMIKGISKADAETLAAEFKDFAGGQIENISRKALIDQVLYGENPSLDKIREMCKKEGISQKDGKARIGFHQ